MNELKIHRFNGTEIFPIETARMFTVGAGDDLTLWFEFEATSAGSKPNADTSEYPARPTAELGIRVTDFDAGKLAGMQLSHPGTADDDEDSCDALFCYYEHQPLRDNQVTIVARNQQNTFHVRWTARTQDVNYYDGSQPDARLEIEAEFQLELKS